jgi:peptidoglycan hydrolase-like protein with peptidoglycan-binding domain
VVRAVGVLSIPVITMPLFAATAQAAGIPAPPTKKLPSALDVAPPYEPQRICDPTPKPGVVAFAELVTRHYAATSRTTYGISRSCGSGVTEHSDGRALDWMLDVRNPTQKAIADSVTRWLSAPDAQGRPGAMARRFGIMYIIWNHRMWRAYDPGRGWAAYTGPVPHTDHIHFSFSWDGAYKRTSWWTGKALTTVDLGPAAAPRPTSPPATPTATGYPTLARGSRGAVVAIGQRAVGTAADGDFGPLTEAAVRAWQGRHGVKATGQLDQPTWARLVALRVVPARTSPPVTTPPVTTADQPTSPLAAHAKTTLRRGASGPAVLALQRALRVAADGAFGTVTEAAVKAFQARRNLPANGIVGPSTWAALMGQPASTSTSAASRSSATPRATTAYTRYLSTVLRPGSRGEAVRVLQRALGGLADDGAYGARTAAAVKAFQKAHKLAATGVTDGKVWQALENRDYPLRGYYGTVLRQGSRGAAVVALQKALRITADGAFGPMTTAAVKALQGRARIARTGTVASVTWKALEAELRRR